VSEKCLGTEVPVDCKSVRIRLMVSQSCDETKFAVLWKALGCIKVDAADQNGNPFRIIPFRNFYVDD